jgi:hypothetical protein
MTFISRLLGSCLAAALLLARPAMAAEEAAPAAEDHTADFKVLTTDFQRLDAIFATFTDPVHKIPTSGFIYLLKQRATLLGWKPPQGMLMGGGGGRGAGGGGNIPGYGGRGPAAKIEFDQVKYDELRYDINLQYQRIASYLAPLRTTPPLSEPTVSIDLRNLSIDPANPAEVKAALGVLDTEIKRASTRTTSPAEVARLERLKQRRAQLGQQFTTARWDELLAEFAPAE